MNMPSDATIALFGATGNIGKDLLRALSADPRSEGFKFLVFTRDRDSALKKFADLPTLDAFDFVRAGDGAAVLAETLKSFGVKTCFVCIPQDLIYKAKEYVEPIADACAAANVERVVKVGTFEPSRYEYGRRHVAAEECIKDRKIKLTVLQAGALSSNPDYLGPAPPGAPYVMLDVFSALSHLLKVGLAPFRTLGSCASFFGEGKVPFVDTRDLADALVAVLLDPSAHDGKTYTIVSDPHIGTKEIASTYGSLLGRTIPVKACGEAETRAILKMSGLPDQMVDLLIEMFGRFSEGVGDCDSDDFAKLTQGKTARTFAKFAEEKVLAASRPPPRWVLQALFVSGVAATIYVLQK